jgi:sulfur carrier protein
MTPVRVTANGDEIDLPDGAALTELLERLGLGQKWVVVERNGEPVDRAAMGSVALADGDRLEIVRAVAGG